VTIVVSFITMAMLYFRGPYHLWIDAKAKRACRAVSSGLREGWQAGDAAPVSVIWRTLSALSAIDAATQVPAGYCIIYQTPRRYESRWNPDLDHLRSLNLLDTGHN
jgi:hypothetical protein